jgi:hypothetical protein
MFATVLLGNAGIDDCMHNSWTCNSCAVPTILTFAESNVASAKVTDMQPANGYYLAYVEIDQQSM